MNKLTTLDFIANKFQLDYSRRSPIEILKTNRRIMAETLKELGFNTGAEVGVAKGEHSELLCQVNPELHLYCIDPWEGYSGYRDYLHERLQGFNRDAEERLSKYNTTIIRKYSMDAVLDFPNDYFDFVYIDGAHDFVNVAKDIDGWIKKVKYGGILYGHDFKRSNNPRTRQHVQDVVQAYCYALEIDPWFILGTRGPHNGEYQEGTRSWMIVK